MTPGRILALAALYAVFAAAILLATMATGHAEPIGWRIEVRACTPTRCRPLTPSAYHWGGKYACQIRAERITALADLTHLLPAGARISARCTAIDGIPRA